MTTNAMQSDVPTGTLLAAAEAAGRAIPPAWPLASTVAVNPFLGQTGEGLASAGARLARVSGTPVTLPRAAYRTRIEAGEITDADLEAALAACTDAARPADLDALKVALARAPAPRRALPTVADLAAQASGMDWPGFIDARFGAWAASWFDQGQALWSAPRARTAWLAWQAVATHDLTPEIQGLKHFCRRVTEAPDSATAAITQCAARLGLTAGALETYFHAVLASLGGWAHAARYRLWQAELKGGSDGTLVDFLAIRLFWETRLLEAHEAAIGDRWRETLAAHAAPLEADADLVLDAILQAAAERAGQRELLGAFAEIATPAPGRPELQAAFCIDVRSEVFRRALESLDPSIRTLGFAGFFGLTANHRRFASDVDEARLPVLLNAGLETRAGGPADAEHDLSARHTARASRAWGRFKLAAVSSFAFVEAAGPVYIGKLVRDALGLVKQAAPNDPAPHVEPALDLEARIEAAATVLGAMSLTKDFAPLVVLAGHGASVTNNPHASALHCGACGGYSGEVNARLLAGLLNDRGTRAGLAERGIEIPADTLFVGALHDTTTDAMTLYDGDVDASGHGPALERARRWFEEAGRLTRAERAARLPRADRETDLLARANDWAEVRPEWGLAGCRAFIAAPRARTAAGSQAGRAFLHDYSWQEDEGFGVLELILTAPVVVASWISLQYYGSTVAPDVFGGGNKLLHNVTGGMGVVEGNGGALRVGLPWQSVHDGEDYMHEPLRLSVFVQAPREAITDVLAKHEGVRALFDNGWLHLFALEDEANRVWRYDGELSWKVERGIAPVPQAAAEPVPQAAGGAA
ncbi:MAG: DUF2309 domain-containing protein [Pseudomonadales bacterium]|jgi:uncharacterized protein YbcC (UPF0753/DUF2309 family)|nr:DUF2309 domain-containing protein [Pseudomonadales bacterium]